MPPFCGHGAGDAGHVHVAGGDEAVAGVAHSPSELVLGADGGFQVVGGKGVAQDVLLPGLVCPEACADVQEFGAREGFTENIKTN
mgnify:CR=1 FL=1